MRVLVVTVVHHPADARILARQIAALIDGGHDVTYAAPWRATGTSAPAGLRVLELPRATGRRRVKALHAARRVLAAEAGTHDIVVLHDPELLTVAAAAGATPVVWDVHEDLGAALADKAWLPGVARRPVRAAVRSLERRAEAHHHLMLAESGYQDRFVGDHPVVPNEPAVPAEVSAPGTSRVVHVGRHSAGRGVAELIALSNRLTPGVHLHLYGWAEPEWTPNLMAADVRLGPITWHGRVTNPEALAALDGALAGLSLLQDLPNYRHSRPTKVVEYMARGVPVITTPTPVAADLVESYDCGIVVPYGDVGAVADAVAELVADPDRRIELGRNGHRAAMAHHNWQRSGPVFVDQLERWANPGRI